MSPSLSCIFPLLRVLFSAIVFIVFAAGLTLSSSSTAFGCGRDKKNNLIPCENVNCPLQATPTRKIKCEKSLFLNLPKDLLIAILKLLDLGEIHHLSEALTPPSLPVYSIRPYLKEKIINLLYRESPEINQAMFDLLPRDEKGAQQDNPSLEDIGLLLDRFNTKWLYRFPNLKKLRIQSASGPSLLFSVFLKNIQASKNLKSLTLDFLSIDPDSNLSSLTPLGIEQLHLYELDCTSKQFKQFLALLPGLTELSMDGMSSNSPLKDFEIDLHDFPKLKKLTLPEGHSISQAQISSEIIPELLTSLEEVLIDGLFQLLYFPELHESDQLKLKQTLKILTRAPYLKTVLPPLSDQSLSWRTNGEEYVNRPHRYGIQLRLNYDTVLSLRLIDYPVAGHSLLPLDSELESWKETEWGKSLWVSFLAANLNWDLAMDEALKLQDSEKGEALTWLFKVFLSYATYVNPDTVSPYFESLMDRSKKLANAPLTGDQEKYLRAQWLARIADYEPEFAHLETQELTTLALDPDSYDAFLKENKLPLPLLDKRIEMKQRQLRDAVQNAERTCFTSGVLADPEFKCWTETLSTLLDTTHSERDSTAEHALIIQLSTLLKFSLTNPTNAKQAGSLYAPLIQFFLALKKPEEATFWIRQLIQYPDSYNFTVDSRQLWDSFYNLLKSDPVYAKRLIELTEPLFTKAFNYYKIFPVKPLFFAESEHLAQIKKSFRSLKVLYRQHVQDEKKEHEHSYRIQNGGSKPSFSLEVVDAPIRDSTPLEEKNRTPPNLPSLPTSRSD